MGQDRGLRQSQVLGRADSPAESLQDRQAATMAELARSHCSPLAGPERSARGHLVVFASHTPFPRGGALREVWVGTRRRPCTLAPQLSRRAEQERQVPNSVAAKVRPPKGETSDRSQYHLLRQQFMNTSSSTCGYGRVQKRIFKKPLSL